MEQITSQPQWVYEALEKMVRYKGRGAVQITGRQTGKSMLSGQALKRLMDDIMLRPVEDLTLSEGTVYGARYYCVEPVGGSWREMEAWLYDTLGPTSNNIWQENTAPNPGERWYANNRKFWFRDIKDRDWFILRWRS
jgi:hypothetical protein